MNEERTPLFDSFYFALWEDGTFGHSDGVGFCGETSAEEVYELYKVLKIFYAGKEIAEEKGLDKNE